MKVKEREERGGPNSGGGGEVRFLLPLFPPARVQVPLKEKGGMGALVALHGRSLRAAALPLLASPLKSNLI